MITRRSAIQAIAMAATASTLLPRRSLAPDYPTRPVRSLSAIRPALAETVPGYEASALFGMGAPRATP